MPPEVSDEMGEAVAQFLLYLADPAAGRRLLA